MQNAKLIIEVQAGLLPGTAMPEHTKRWAVTSVQWEQDAQMALIETVGKAQMYASYLMLSPDRVNWVRTDWVWM